jgi:hypothetical protein
MSKEKGGERKSSKFKEVGTESEKQFCKLAIPKKESL